MEISGVTIEGSTIVAPPPPPGGSLSFNFNNLAYDTNNDFNMETGDFTVECFTYITNATYGALFRKGFYAEVNSNTFRVGTPTTTFASISVTGYTNVWVHWAITRASNILRIFRNGTQISTDISNSENLTSAATFSVGISENTNLVGRMAQFNWVKGTALYISNFTPPSVPITPNANCKLLLLVKTDPTKFADSSGTNKTISNPVTTVAFSSDTPFTY